MTNAEMFQDVFGRFPYLPCEDGYYIDAKLQDRQWWDMPFRRDISMGVLIKGMGMPKQGRVTLQIGADGAIYIVDKCEITAEKYEKNFEAVEVPEWIPAKDGET